jgi:hypothetical protein
MSWSTPLGILAGVALIAFIIFAFRQGQSVKPSGKDISQKDDYT